MRHKLFINNNITIGNFSHSNWYLGGFFLTLNIVEVLNAPL